MKLALLKGNRFNPWHLQAFCRLDGDPEVTAFRAESEIQQHFDARDDGSVNLRVERIHFDTQKGNPLTRLVRIFETRYREAPPRIVPFHERLEGFDLIQTWELFTDWTEQAVLARQEYGVPLAVMVWDNLPFNNEQTPARRDIKRKTIETADRFLVHTDRSACVLRIEGVDEAKVVKVNPGVDTDTFCPGDADRKALKLDEDEFVILFVGWLLPRKGIDFLLLALGDLIADSALSNFRIRLVVVGSGPGEDRVHALADRLNLRSRCTFMGSLPYNEMPNVFRAADVFVLPSIAAPGWQEQFGMSLIEAMASGTPVVTTLSGAIPEIAGEVGILCQPNDFLALYESLRDLILDAPRREDMGAAGRKRALERFRLDAYAKALSEIYEDVVKT